MSQYKGRHKKVTRLVNCIGAFEFCLFLTVHTFAFAEQPPSETVVPVEHASFHQLVFADEDIAILNNLYPPTGDSGFHAHYRDLFYVVIQPSQSSGQNLGKPLTAAPIVPAGTAGYSAVGAEPRIHRVVNGDKSTYQIIVVELRRSSSFGNAISSRDAAPQYAQIFDNPRMRAWRLVLEPGQSAPAISQGNQGYSGCRARWRTDDDYAWFARPKFGFAAGGFCGPASRCGTRTQK